jgi:hypothetical protein
MRVTDRKLDPMIFEDGQWTDLFADDGEIVNPPLEIQSGTIGDDLPAILDIIGSARELVGGRLVIESKRE